MELGRIYQPIAGDMAEVERLLSSSIRESRERSILSMSDFLLKSPGKRTRPALVILSERAASAGKEDSCNHDELITIAAAVELIHTASLIHDDVLDGAGMRHNKPSINAKWGSKVSIALGDYIYSKAFDLIGKCKRPDVFACISEAIYVMCEGELAHICNRGNLDLSKESYNVIIKKKTASLFAACCHAGGIIGNHTPSVQAVLRDFGFNFGLAFQIIDDCRDIVSGEKTLGKHPGQDVITGEMTLPLLNLAESLSKSERIRFTNMLSGRIDERTLEKIREIFVNSDAHELTQRKAFSYISRAKRRLAKLKNSDYKRSMNLLADYIAQGSF